MAYSGGQQVFSPYAAMGNSPGMMIDPNGEMFERAQAGADAYTENPFPTSEANFYSSNRVWGMNVMFGMNSAEVLDFNDNPSYKGTSSFGGGLGDIFKGLWYDNYDALSYTLDKSSGQRSIGSVLIEWRSRKYAIDGLTASLGGGGGGNGWDVLEGAHITAKREDGKGSRWSRFWRGGLDVLQTSLDIAGLVPGVGEIADLINAGIYTLRGDYMSAGFSLAAMVPIGGQAATVAKLANKITKGAGKGVKNVIPKGFKETKKFGYQHGQKVYEYKGKYYSRDVGSGNGRGSHNGGEWKVFEQRNGKLHRIGTADGNLNIFKN